MAQIDSRGKSNDNIFYFKYQEKLLFEFFLYSPIFFPFVFSFCAFGYNSGLVILAGIIKGDEIMVINGAIVSDLDMMYLESVLQEEQSLCMMMR